jgi:putative flavoprotein involved in K+ transport
VGQTWRDRWDSFCLVTPNWTVQLPGGAYSGDDPDGFMPRDDIVAHLETYAGLFSAPVREGVSVASLGAAPTGGFLLDSSVGEIQAEAVVVCTGAYQRPHRPPGADSLPAELLQLDTEDYRAPDALPSGKVLVVGSGQSGCQLTEELHEAGRDVFLACGKAPWAPRRIGGRDLLCWVSGTPFLEALVTDMPSPPDRLGANGQATGRSGGHDLHYRTLQRMGVTLLGHFRGAANGSAYFAPDLADSIAFGDARYAEVRNLIRQVCAARGLAVPEMPGPPGLAAEPPDSVSLAGLAAVIFTSGFRPDYSNWVRFEAFDELRFPLHRDGANTVIPGLYFCGVHMLRKRKSSLLMGVGEDATIVAQTIAERRATRASA